MRAVAAGREGDFSKEARRSMRGTFRSKSLVVLELHLAVNWHRTLPVNSGRTITVAPHRLPRMLLRSPGENKVSWNKFDSSARKERAKKRERDSEREGIELQRNANAKVMYRDKY